MGVVGRVAAAFVGMLVAVWLVSPVEPPRADIGIGGASMPTVMPTTTAAPTTTTTLSETPPIQPPVSVTTVWDRLADCEPDTGHGRLGWVDQFIWDRHRGTAPANPAQASWVEEVAAAERLLTETGGRYTMWPGCAQRLGLPR